MKLSLRQISRLIIGLIITSIFFFLIGKYVIGVIGCAILTWLSFIWFRKLGEDLAVYTLKQKGGSTGMDVLIKVLSKRAINAIKKLEKKRIVEVKDGFVYLIDKNYESSFERRNRKKIKYGE